MSTERAHGSIVSDVRIGLFTAAPHSIVQVRSQVGLHWLFTTTTALALEGSLDMDLHRSVRNAINSLFVTKIAAAQSKTDFTVADWNQVVDAAKAEYVTWFQQQNWHPWR
jgi:hypothetical protein